MQITINRKALTGAWKTAAAAVPTKTPKDILKSVKCEAAGGVITLTATDAEVTIRVKVAGTIAKEGACLLPADRFGSVLQAAIGEDVSISTSETGVLIQCGRSKVALQTAKVDEYPVSSVETQPVVTLPAKVLQSAVAFCMTCMDVAGSMRYAASGIYVGSKDGKLVIAATDGKRLARQMTVPCEPFEGVVLPAAAAACLKSAGMADDAPVAVSVSGSAVAFNSPDVSLECRVLEGRWPVSGLDFPDQGKVFSTSRIAAGIWCGLWNQVKATLDQESMGADCQFGESITLKHRGPAGESEASAPCEFSGDPQSMQFAVDLVIPTSKVFDPIEILSVETATPMDNDAEFPVTFRAKSGDRTFLLMSMNVE